MGKNDRRRSIPRGHSLLDELRNLPVKPGSPKKPGKKKLKKVDKMKVEEKDLSEDIKDTTQEDNNEEFEYSWQTCACGMNHPPVPHFFPPDGIRCTYYWQIADHFPFLTLHRLLTSEIKFLKADADQSGLIEYPELKTLLQSILGTQDVTDRMVRKTFEEVDTDHSGRLDFLEVLAVVNALLQREGTNLPDTVQKEYSKVCSLQ